MTQEQLGRDAGYRTGAGVAISRLEHGLLQPGPDRFAGIATALGLTPEELEALASETVPDHAVGGSTATGQTGAAAGSRSARAKAPPGQKELDARRRAIEHETGERARTLTDLSRAFNAAHDRARVEFFLKLVEIATRVEGAPPLDAARLGDEDATTSRADDGAPMPPPGVADRGPTPGVDRGVPVRASGVARGTVVLAGIAASPVAFLFAGGLAHLDKRNRTQRQTLAEQLGEAEAQLAATRPGVEALRALLPRAADTLDYIATHAGHALDRWEHQLGPGSDAWGSLDRVDQQRYRDFMDVAEAQIAIANLRFEDLLITRDADRDQLIHLADEVLERARDTVRAHV
jgi:hypothetical protein